MRKFFTRIVCALRNTEWIVSLHRSLSEAEWFASTVQWFTRHVVVGAVVMFTGLSTGLIVAVRALDWSLILQWVVGVGWVVFCGLVFYKVNKHFDKMAAAKEEKEAGMERPTGAVSIPTPIGPAESAKVPNPSEPAGSEMTDDDDREEANPSGLWPLLRFFAKLNRPSLPRLSDPDHWGDKRKALNILEGSPLVEVRTPKKHVWGAGESLSRYRLRQFEDNYPEAVRDGQYQLEWLEWWIDMTFHHDREPKQ